MKWLLVSATALAVVASAVTVGELLDHPGGWQCSGGCTDPEAAFSNFQKDHRRDMGLLATMVVLLTVLQVVTVGYVLSRGRTASPLP